MDIKQEILEARVTVYFDGLIFLCSSEGSNPVGQAGILTTASDHRLRIIIRVKGQLDQVWPPRDPTGIVPPIHYSRLRRMAALQLYVAGADDAPAPNGTAQLIDIDPAQKPDGRYSIRNVLDFDCIHDDLTAEQLKLKDDTLAPIKIPQGLFYSAQNEQAILIKTISNQQEKGETITLSSIAAAAIRFDQEPCYLILRPEDDHNSNKSLLPVLPKILKLQPGLQYEVIILNGPAEADPSQEDNHFGAYYDALSEIPENERRRLEPSTFGIAPSSPPCNQGRGSNPRTLVWRPTKDSAQRAHDHHGHHHDDPET